MSNTIISINKPNNDDKKDKEETIGDIPVITEEDAEKFASISLSYEQINNFNIDSDNNKITKTKKKRNRRKRRTSSRRKKRAYNRTKANNR